MQKVGPNCTLFHFTASHCLSHIARQQKRRFSAGTVENKPQTIYSDLKISKPKSLNDCICL